MYELMKKEPNWHIRDIQGASSIHYAFRYCESKMLADIFRHRKIDVDILDHKDLIKVAAAYGHLDIVMQYLEKVSTQTDRSSTIHQFILAAVRCRGKSILSHFADEVNNVSSRLYWICRQSNGDELIHYDKYCKTLITEESMSHQYEDDYYFTPLMIAIKYRRVQCIKKLVQKIQDNDITDLLLNAAKKKNVNVIDNDMMGNTPVHICAQFLEDQFAIRNWMKGHGEIKSMINDEINQCDKDLDENEPYTLNPKILLRNHPLFIMAEKD
ncbi:unnamed protein product [Rotaria sordida]|uniref:Uncharacterized protein n=1 Tax=Rotaria sordida TaxID=392033 RepID=A0A815F8P2_9BILA|nr:unnamed protein product [Rotaria sordida]